MEDSKIVICRLCLNFTTFDECQILDAVSRDMLKFIVPEVDLDISQDPKICQTCYKTVLRCYRFKSNCNKDINTEIKKNLEEESDSISIEIDDVENKCNFCLNSRDNEDVEEFNDRKTYFTEVLQKCLSEWNLSSKTIPCKKCLDVLTSQFTFIGNCVDTEDKLKHYRLTHGTNSKGKLNLYEAVQHILSKESRDLDVMIKADQEIPFPELVVNTDTLKMEEVDIKSEVMDEDYSEFEEEPGSSGSEKHHGTSKVNPLVFKVPKQLKRVQNEALSVAKKAKVDEQDPAKNVNKRSIGVQVYPKDLIQTCSIGIQVDIISSPPAGADSDEEVVTSTTSSRKKKFKPRILRRSDKADKKK